MLTDETSRKLHPWLRVVENGDATVNTTRADGSLRVASLQPVGPASKPAPIYARLNELVAPAIGWTADVRTEGRLGRRPKIEAQPVASDSFVNVFIEFFPEPDGGDNTAMRRIQDRLIQLQADAGPDVASVATTRRNFLCATVPVAELPALAEDPAVAYVHPAQPLTLDQPVVTSVPPKTTPKSKAVGSAAKYGRGRGVLIGIIDVNGFDFSHPDFLDDAGNTRFIAIWDQGGETRPSPKGFRYGSEMKQTHLNAAIAASKQPGMPPAPWIEKQSQQQAGSHGTHVASIAAGRSGVCPEALIAAVVINVPAAKDALEERRLSFSDTSRLTEAVEYLLQVAQEERLPISINISLGTNGGAHDGSSGVSRWLDAYLAAPGRAICVAAGNAGQEKAQFEGDLGWIMGRIHTSGRIPSRGLEVEIEWVVIGDGIEDWSENELEIWYSAQDMITASLKPPGAEEWIVVEPRQYVQNRRLPSGTTISIYNEMYHPTTGGNYIAMYLSPNLDPKTYRGIESGIWRVRLKGVEVRDGRFDAWIERDDPLELGREGMRRLFRFPSFFSEKSTVDSHSIGSLACGHRVVAVANLDDVRQRINASSGQGPTRDGRRKPEIAAPGTEILAANGFGDPDEPWIAMTGTSMASPYVTGILGLMLAINPQLTAAQCLGILQRTARPLAGASYEWANDMGFGRIAPEAALDEAKAVNVRVSVS